MKKMKLLIPILGISTLTSSAMVLVGCNQPTPVTPTITIVGDTTAYIGNNKVYQVTVSPDDYSSEVIWSTSSKTIATIEQNGTLTPKKAGTVTIKATAKGDSSVFGELEVNVVAPFHIEFENPCNNAIEINQSAQLVLVKDDPEAQSVPEVNWTCPVPAKLSISETGLATAHDVSTSGGIKVTATSKTDESIFNTILIYTGNKPTTIELEGQDYIGIGSGARSLSPYEATVTGEKASNAVIWTVDDESMATIDSFGYLEGKKTGTVTVIGTSRFDESKSATKVVNIVNAPEKLEFVDAPTGVDSSDGGKSVNLREYVKFTGTAPIDEQLTWKSSKEDYATVDSKGVVTAKPGIIGQKVTITATSVSNPRVKKDLTLLVGPFPKQIIIVGSESHVVAIGGKKRFSVDAGTADSRVDWSIIKCEPEGSATITAGGELKGIKAGVVTIQATSQLNPSIKSSEEKINIIEAPTSIDVLATKTIYNLAQGEKMDLPKVDVQPSTLSEEAKKIIWTSDKPGIADIENGQIVAKDQTGLVTITASSEKDSDLKESFNVFVIDANMAKFENDTWENVIKTSDKGFDELKKTYGVESFIGLTRTVDVNGIAHTVRVIGENVDSYGSGDTAALTYQFEDVISDKNGDVLRAEYNQNKWQFDYIESQNGINKMLNGPADETIKWYEKGQSTPSESYTQPLIQMIDQNVANAIKSINKKQLTNNKGTEGWSAKDFTPKLFLPSLSSIFSQKGIEKTNYPAFTDKNKELYKSETKRYAFFDNGKWDFTSIGDGEIGLYGTSCTPYEKLLRTDVSGNESDYWIATPNLDLTYPNAWYYSTTGLGFQSGSSVTTPKAICPCFCI